MIRRTTLALSLVIAACSGGAGNSRVEETPEVAPRRQALTRVRTPDVVLTTDAERADALRLARGLQEMHDAFAQRLFPCARGIQTAPARVFALEQDGDVGRLAGEDWIGGVYGRPPLPWLPDQIVTSVPHDLTATRVYRHELAHRFLAMCYPRLPRWLNEGLAGLYESVFLAESGRAMLGAASYLYSNNGEYGLARRGQVVFQVLPRERLPSVTQLRAMDRRAFYAAGEETEEASQVRGEHYGGAWGAAHMLLLGERPVREAFARYLDALASTPDPEPEIWDRAFGELDLDARLRRYRERDTIRSRPVGEPVRRYHPIRIVELSGFQTHVEWARVALTGGQLRLALAHLQQADRVRPGDANVLLLRAALRALIHEDGVSDLLDAAVAADPDHLTARRARLSFAATGPHADEDLARLERSARSVGELTALADAYARRREWSPALRYANRAIRRDRVRWRAWRARARALAATDHLPEAKSAYQRAIATVAHSQHRVRTELEDELAAVSRRAMDGAPRTGASSGSEFEEP